MGRGGGIVIKIPVEHYQSVHWRVQQVAQAQWRGRRIF